MEIEITVECAVPSRIPDRYLNIHLPADSTVASLLNRLSSQAGIPPSPNHILQDKHKQILDRAKSLRQSDVISGSTLLWTEETVAVKTSCCKFSTWWFLAAISFLIGACGLAAVVVIESQQQYIFQYGIVFDAGSSHTSMYIYKWTGSKINNTAIASQFTDVVKPKYPGLADLSNNLSLVHDVIAQCLDKAKQRIPPKNYKKTPVYLGATAGMRLLHELNSTVTDLILNTVRDTVAKYPFKSNKNDSRIISGSEEGTFSWITSNYISGVFHVSPPAKIIHSTQSQGTFGALDLGGASAQITFVPQNTSMPAGYRFDVELYEHEHTVYTHSFLCYGVNEVLRRFRAELIREQNYSSVILNPCLPDGFNKSIKYKSIFDSYCVSGFHGEKAFGSAIVPSLNTDQNTTYLFKGKSDSAKCETLVSKYLFNFNNCTFSSCSFNNQYQPPVHGQFYAFSSFYYVTHFLNLTDGKRQFSLEDFQKNVTSFCNKTWAEIKTIPAVENKTKPFYCFQATFINILLVKGYKFNSSNWKTLKFVEKVAGTKVGWSLGFILEESNEIPAVKPQDSLNTFTFSVLVILFILFIFISFGFIYHAKTRHQSDKMNHYEKFTDYGTV